MAYLEATEADVALATALARDIFARGDEALAPQARRLLAGLHAHADEVAHANDCAPEEVDVTRRELRERLGWSDTQVRAATDRLVALEYLVVSGGGRGRCRTYRLVAGFDTFVAPEKWPRTSARFVEFVTRSRELCTPSTSGEMDEFVEFVPFAADHEHPLSDAASYPEMSYPEVLTTTEPVNGEAMKLDDAVREHLTWLAVHGYAAATLRVRRHYLASLVTFLESRDVIGGPRRHAIARSTPTSATSFTSRSATGQPLSFLTQAQRLIPVKGFFAWLAQKRLPRLRSGPRP